MTRATVPTSPPVTELGHLRCCTVCGASYRTDFERCPLDGGAIVIASSDPLIGTIVGGHYEIEALIGVGAMGRVYRAHHVRLVNLRYAVKVLFGELTASATMRMRFAHEAENASRLEHPNLVGVLDFGCSDTGLMYLVMELVEGPTLAALIEQGPMPPARAIGFARQLCIGLGHAHARGLIHRDFKPENILVGGQPGAEVLRIADFGLAISIADDEEDDARLTGSGVVCTPAYAAPEQLLGRDTDQRADLYALGVTLYEMLTGGVLPFARGSQDAMIWKVTAEWPAVSSQAPDVPSGLASLTRRLLARSPTMRPGSALEVLSILDKVASVPLRVSSPPSRRRRWWGVAIGGATALAGALTFARWDSEPQVASAATTAVEIFTVHASEETARSRLAPSVTREPAVLAAPEEEPAPVVPRPPARRVPSRTPALELPSVLDPDRAAEVAGVRASAPGPAGARRDAPADAKPSVQVALQPDAGKPVVEKPAAPVAPTTASMAVRSPTRPVAPAVRKPGAPPRIIALEVVGAMQPSVVRRALARVLPSLHNCTSTVGARVVRTSFTIEETRRAVDVRSAGAGASCIAGELAKLRTELAPDLGEVTVDVRIAFDGS